MYTLLTLFAVYHQLTAYVLFYDDMNDVFSTGWTITSLFWFDGESCDYTTYRSSRCSELCEGCCIFVQNAHLEKTITNIEGWTSLQLKYYANGRHLSSYWYDNGNEKILSNQELNKETKTFLLDEPMSATTLTIHFKARCGGYIHVNNVYIMSTAPTSAPTASPTSTPFIRTETYVVMSITTITLLLCIVICFGCYWKKRRNEQKQNDVAEHAKNTDPNMAELEHQKEGISTENINTDCYTARKRKSDLIIHHKRAEIEMIANNKSKATKTMEEGCNNTVLCNEDDIITIQ